MEIYVGVVLIDEQEKIFLIKEKDKNEIGKDRWNIPGGSVDNEETLIEAATREAKEESGCDVKISSLLGCYLCKKGDKSWIYVVFEGNLIGKKCQPSDPDITRRKWFDKDNFLHLDSSQIVHPDMQLVYNIAIDGKGLGLESIKNIDYNVQ